MLLGADDPAILPPDVEAYFFSSYRPPQSPAGKPGHYVPAEVPEEVLRRVLAAYEKDASKAEDAQKIREELKARAGYASDPEAYHPWTGDRICDPCKEFRAMPWSWRGVKAIPDPADKGYWYLTCGMLRDAGGLVNNAAECAIEQKAALKKYVEYIEEKEREERRGAREAFTSGLIFSAVMAVATFGVGAVLGAGTLVSVAVTTAMSLLTSFVQNPEAFAHMDLRDGLKMLGGALLNLVPVIGGTAGQVIKMTVQTADSANEFLEYMKTRKEINAALDAKSAEIDGLLMDLTALIKARASFEELRAANIATQKAIADALAEKKAKEQKTLLAIGGALALALLMRRR